ncbi:hypothetical protein ES705_15794 [subsurface metagenome]
MGIFSNFFQRGKLEDKSNPMTNKAQSKNNLSESTIKLLNCYIAFIKRGFGVFAEGMPVAEFRNWNLKFIYSQNN